MEDYTLDSDNIFSNPLFLVALEVELPKTEFPALNIQYTGVGKINATYFALKAIKLYKPTIVINFGSAGSLNKNISGLVQVEEVFQRDMDVRKLGFRLGETPFEDFIDPLYVQDFAFSNKDPYFKRVSCSTGDNFVTEFPELSSDIVDMELYAIAKVCKYENLPLLAWKYISDGADGNSSRDWKKNVKIGVTEFKSKVLNFFERS